MLRRMETQRLFPVSFSKLASFDRCRKQYWFNYLSKLPRPDDEMNGPGLVGTGIHAAMKTLGDTMDANCARVELEQYLSMEIHAAAGPGTEYYRQAFEILETGIAAHESLQGERRWTEMDSFCPAKSMGVTVHGRIDRVEHLGGDSYVVIDWKTGRYEQDADLDLQLRIAHIIARTVRKLPRTAEVRAIAWNLRSGHKREHVFTREHAASTFTHLSKRVAAIQATEQFEATPSWHCRICLWRLQCDAAIDAESGKQFEDFVDGDDVEAWVDDLR